MSKELNALVKKLQKKVQKELDVESRVNEGIKNFFKKRNSDEVYLDKMINSIPLSEYERRSSEYNKKGSDENQCWREFFSKVIGPYASIIPVEIIEKFKNKMQEQIDSIDEELFIRDLNQEGVA